jgi:DNA topoisomerase VI subunit A
VYPHNFKNQAQCNNTILECASLLGVDRESLHLRASSRGLYAGMIQTSEPGIGWIDGTKAEAISISSNWITNSEVQCEVTGAKCILVVEKEGAGSRTHC